MTHYFIATCRDCPQSEPPATFLQEKARDDWANAHAERNGHDVARSEMDR